MDAWKLGDLKLTIKTNAKYSGTIRSKRKSDDVEDGMVDALKGAGFANVSVVLSARSLFVFRVP